ncbi:MAG: cadherin-like beta sandwich domain-containing protein, partial [Chitinispirillaceae bacterium]|nr:cadherin-like beta sandwich domain-containing protein [Chitinispirillaceae bacterium]
DVYKRQMYDSDLIFINNENLKEKTFTFPGGISKVVVKVISHDKKDSVEYRVFVERKQSDEARLKTIVFSPSGMLEPQFNPEIKEYSLIIPDSVYELTVVPLPMHRKAEVEINNSKTFVSTIYLNSHQDTGITIKVTSESKSKEEKYKVSIKRSSSDIALLERVELSVGELIPKFHRDTLNYEIRVSATTDSIRIKPIRANLKSEVKVDNSIVLPNSFSEAIAIASGKSTLITITVTSESGIYGRKYNFIVNRPYVLNVTSNNSEAGMVEPLGTFEVFADSIILLKAFSNEGYFFVKWAIKEGEGVIIEDEMNPLTSLKLKSNASIVAEFKTITENWIEEPTETAEK